MLRKPGIFLSFLCVCLVLALAYLTIGPSERRKNSIQLRTESYLMGLFFSIKDIVRSNGTVKITACLDSANQPRPAFGGRSALVVARFWDDKNRLVAREKEAFFLSEDFVVGKTNHCELTFVFKVPQHGRYVSLDFGFTDLSTKKIAIPQ